MQMAKIASLSLPLCVSSSACGSHAGPRMPCCFSRLNLGVDSERLGRKLVSRKIKKHAGQERERDGSRCSCNAEHYYRLFQ